MKRLSNSARPALVVLVAMSAMGFFAGCGSSGRHHCRHECPYHRRHPGRFPATRSRLLGHEYGRRGDIVGRLQGKTDGLDLLGQLVTVLSGRSVLPR